MHGWQVPEGQGGAEGEVIDVIQHVVAHDFKACPEKVGQLTSATPRMDAEQDRRSGDIQARQRPYRFVMAK